MPPYSYCIPLSPPPPVLFWTYLTRSLQFPSARDLRYTVSYTRPASLKPVKKLGGTFVLTTPRPSERGECVVQILKKSCGSRFKKKTNYLKHRIIHHRTLKIWSASPPPVSFVIICPSLFTLITGIATLAILLIPTHDDDVVTRDGPHGQTHVIELWTHCLTWASIVISKKAFMSYEPILELGAHEFNDQQQIIYQHSFVLCSKRTKFKYVNSFPLS